FLWFVLITLLNVTLIILTLSVSRLLNLLLRLVAFLLFLNPQCLASISRWITASSSWKRFCLFVFRALSSIMVISTNLSSHFFDLVIGKILTSRLSLSKHLAHNLGNLLLLGKIGVFHNRRNASSRLLLLISKHLILCIYLVFRILA